MTIEQTKSQEYTEKEKIKKRGSIIDPSLDAILTKVTTPFIAVNMVRKRCNQLNINKDDETYITLPRLITKVFTEIVDTKLEYQIE